MQTRKSILGFAVGIMVGAPACATDDVFGQAWTFSAASATVNATKADGSSWDLDGSAPDPFARLFLNGGLIGTTPEVQDTLQPVWNFATSPVVVNAGSTLTVDLIDSDVFDDDVIFQQCAVALTTSIVDAAGATCTGAQGSMRIVVTVD